MPHPRENDHHEREQERGDVSVGMEAFGARHTEGVGKQRTTGKILAIWPGGSVNC
jgi:hypothetical protein